MYVEDYIQKIRELVLSETVIEVPDINIISSEHYTMIRGKLIFINGSILDFMELYEKT
ncbi:MAG: hypothetical protein ACE5KE_13085 [Methanosarcinales archaeon]